MKLNIKIQKCSRTRLE